MKLNISISLVEPNVKGNAKKLHCSEFKAHSQASDSVFQFKCLSAHSPGLECMFL